MKLCLTKQTQTLTRKMVSSMNLYFNGNQEPQVVNKEEFITFLYEIANKFDSLNSVSITIKTKDMILLE